MRKKSFITVTDQFCGAGGSSLGAKKAIEDNIKAKGNRPQESAAKGTQGVIIKSDPSKLTAEDRAEIARRVMMGEEITF